VTGDSAIAAWTVAFNPAASNCAQLAADTSKVLKVASTIAIGNEIIAGARPLPPQAPLQLA
jgi:hypothetical protein